MTRRAARFLSMAGPARAGTPSGALAYYRMIGVQESSHSCARATESSRQFAKLASEAAALADASLKITALLRHALHRSGLAMAPFGKAQGGLGLAEPDHQGQLCSILRILGAADLSIARVYEGHVNAISLVVRYGTRTQVDRLAHDVQAGELTGVWGAEDGIGLNRKRHPRGWQLEGRKVLASGAGFVRRPLVTIGCEGGPAMLLLKLAGEESVDVSGWQALQKRLRAHSNRQQNDGRANG